jgi:endonuclease/exonuclease/phosphatase family metal-dependent hydrolase
MHELRVLSYNVRYFGHATRGLASTRRAMERIASAIAALDPLPDLVCLQEVETSSLRSNVAHPLSRPGQTQLSRLIEMLDDKFPTNGGQPMYEAYYFPAHTYGGPGDSPLYTTGLAVLAHRDFSILEHNAEKPHDITHRKIHPVKRLKQTRICAHVRYTHRSGHTIDVFNTHLSLPTTLSRAFWTQERRLGYGPNQLEEAKNLARFVETTRASDRFLIVGDFNALPGSPVYRYLVHERGYADPFAKLHHMTEEDLRHFPTAGFMQMRMRIDHVLSGPGLEWLDFEGSEPFGQRTAPFHGLSDHVPLIGCCRVRA